jgi:hypothetical protein
MSVLPQGKISKVEFCETHNTLWNTNATAIGTTTTAITDLTTKTTAARAAFNAQKIAQDDAKAATLAFNLAVVAMTNAVSDVIKSIKTKAATAGDSVYTLANIPAPANPGPVGELGTPNKFTVALEVNGALTLKWKNTNPKSASGTVYQVFRRVTADGPFEYLGGVGSKKFVDETVPAGSSQVTYQIQAVRSSGVGPWAQYNVNFGVGGSTTVTEGTPVKIAA